MCPVILKGLSERLMSQLAVSTVVPQEVFNVVNCTNGANAAHVGIVSPGSSLSLVHMKVGGSSYDKRWVDFPVSQ